MATKKPSLKSTKAEILAAYDELEKEKIAIKSQLNQAAKETSSPIQEQQTLVVPKMNQSQSIQQKIILTIENESCIPKWIQ